MIAVDQACRWPLVSDPNAVTRFPSEQTLLRDKADDFHLGVGKSIGEGTSDLPTGDISRETSRKEPALIRGSPVVRRHQIKTGSDAIKPCFSKRDAM